jgi:O-antigen biosynthesis protein
VDQVDQPIERAPAKEEPVEAEGDVDQLNRECERLRRQVAALRKQARAQQRRRAAAEAQLVAALKELDRVRWQYRAILASTMWQTLHPLRTLGDRLPPNVRRLSRGALKLAWWTLSFQLWRKLHEPTVVDEPAPPEDIEGYGAWVELYDTISDDDRSAMDAEIGNMARRPLISVMMPVYETPESYLREAIESVRAQRYPNWELCIADDASSSPHIRAVLDEYRAIDPRIKVCFRDENGHISACTNSALALATGDYIALLDADDLLPEHALYVVAAAIAEEPELDLLFSDEDKIDTEGRRFDPYFKSDWNPDLMLGQNMFSHLGVFRRSLVEAIGGCRLGYEGSQDHDLVLRASARTIPERIRHLPYILYHWRAVPGSTAVTVENKNYAVEAARRAIGDYLAEQGTAATVGPSSAPGYHRVHYPLPQMPPQVSLVIPLGARLEIVRTGLTGLLDRTDYRGLELVLLVNCGTGRDVHAYLEDLSGDSRVTIVTDDAPNFSFSRLCNLGVAWARGEVIGLVNDDIEVIEPNWLGEMVGHALRPSVGAVGALLLYPDERIQHAGVVGGLGGVAGHMHVGLPHGDHGYFGRAALTQNLSAVTGACLVMRKSLYQEAGGLDEANLSIAFNDIDLCLRLRQRGYLIVWTPYARLIHHESASRGSDFAPAEIARFRRECAYMERRWGDVLADDPYYSPNHSLELPGFRLAFPPRVEKPWQVFS